ncbi:M23 family metallopeptidase [Microbacterium sp.]|uniref:murein hydrolase activator EnvC family protein n=1 Tax=Microbacterium sp. TaxID=51671 RepID=UPI002812081B|nr:M23 family metallopeptidase [Microbacterium sp.]
MAMEHRTLPDGGRGGRRRTTAAVIVPLTALLCSVLPASAVSAAPAEPLLAHSPPAPAAAAAATAEEAPGFPWRWPVDGPRTVAEPFQAPAHDYGPGHRGMDVVAAPGAQVQAPADGVIAFAGQVVDRPLLTIDHGAGFVTTLEPVRTELSPGERVEAGGVIGDVAAGGHTTLGTLHVGVRLHGEYLNPRPLFGTPPRAVLLPCCE